MSILTVLCCDRCNKDGAVDTPDGRGFYVGRRLDALGWGWKATRDGSGAEKHTCFQCLDEIADAKKVTK